MTDQFQYRDGHLHVEDVAIADIADRVGTPVYVYSSAMLRRQYRVFAMALASACPAVESLICYSVKANSNLAIIRKHQRCGVPVVREGEVREQRRPHGDRSRGELAPRHAHVVTDNATTVHPDTIPDDVVTI